MLACGILIEFLTFELADNNHNKTFSEEVKFWLDTETGEVQLSGKTFKAKKIETIFRSTFNGLHFVEKFSTDKDNKARYTLRVIGIRSAFKTY